MLREFLRRVGLLTVWLEIDNSRSRHPGFLKFEAPFLSEMWPRTSRAP